MKPSQLLVAAAGAIALSACSGSISTTKKPAWTDPPLCQKTFPAVTDYQQGDKVGDEESIVIAVPAVDGLVNVYVVDPRYAKVHVVMRLPRDLWEEIVDPFSDRVAGGVWLPPPPPPPPIGQPRLWNQLPPVLAGGGGNPKLDAQLAEAALPPPDASPAEQEAGLRYLTAMAATITQQAPMTCQ